MVVVDFSEVGEMKSFFFSRDYHGLSGLSSLRNRPNDPIVSATVDPIISRTGLRALGIRQLGARRFATRVSWLVLRKTENEQGDPKDASRPTHAQTIGRLRAAKSVFQAFDLITPEPRRELLPVAGDQARGGFLVALCNAHTYQSDEGSLCVDALRVRTHE